MTEQNIVRILWLSDIHFRARYSVAGIDADENLNEQEREQQKAQLPRLETMINQFLELASKQVQELSESGDRIDYILISGDLGFSGSEEDYNLLSARIVTPLRKITGAATKIICIPGNHDVNWGNTEFFARQFTRLGDMSPEKIKDEYVRLRQDFIARKESLFINIFAHYTSYFKSQVLPTLSGVEVSVEYQREGLFGIITDKQKNIKFNLMNSAWFALGEKFDRLLLAEIMTHFDELKIKARKGEQEFKDEFERISQLLIALKSASTEYGEQTLGKELMPHEWTVDQLNDQAGLFTITCFHHPPNWLQYGLKYNLESDGHDELFFNKILEASEILLTGHEHVPASSHPESLSNGLFHLKGGMFMQDDMVKEGIEGEHRFSILEVDTGRFSFNERKYIYNFKQSRWEPYKNPPKEREVSRKDPNFNPAKISLLQEKISKEANLSSILKRHYLGDQAFDELVLESDHENYRLYALKSNNAVYKMVILPTNHQYFSSLLTGRPDAGFDYEHCLDPVIKKLEAYPGCNQVSIITPDFLVEEPTRIVYTQKRSVAVRDAYTYIVRKADFIFNRSRHNFFNRFEEKSKENTSSKCLIINEIDFNQVKELSFTCQVIPFWTIDRYT